MTTTVAALGTVVLNIGSAIRLPPGEGRSVRIGPVSMAVFRTRAGKVFVTGAECPHKGGPIADGTLGNAGVMCPPHSCSFDLETGQSGGGECSSLRTYSSRVNEDGDILVGVD